MLKPTSINHWRTASNDPHRHNRLCYLHPDQLAVDKMMDFLSYVMAMIWGMMLGAALAVFVTKRCNCLDEE